MGCCSSSAVVEPAAEQDAYPDHGKKLRTDARVQQVYHLEGVLGTGGFSVVRLATERATGQQYACKIMSLPRRGHHDERREDVLREIDVLLDLDHPNIVGLREYFVHNDKVYLIMELLRGGELLDAVNTRGQYGEADARTIFRQLIEGVQYLHSRGVVHRDLKLDNLLLVNKGDITTVKIADFGVARKLHPAQGLSQMRTMVGTPQYMAPEIICSSKRQITTSHSSVYGPACDLWSCGVILFMLLGGYPPFWDDSHPMLLRKIAVGAFRYSDPVWKSVSWQAKDLISRLLVVDPAKRLTVEQVLAHPWMALQVEMGQGKTAAFTGVISRLRRYKSGRRTHACKAPSHRDGDATVEAAELPVPTELPPSAAS